MRIMRLLFNIVLILSSFMMSASGIEKMFIHRSAGGESLYFIFSQSLPADKETKPMVKSIDYDYTYLQKTDSIAMLVGFTLPKMVKDTKIEIGIDKDIYSVVPQLIYADLKGGKISYRYRLDFPFYLFQQMYESPYPFSVTFRYSRDNNEECLTFKYDEKKWIDNRDKINQIIDLIKLNTGKQ